MRHAEPMFPRPFRVTAAEAETHDVATLDVEPADGEPVEPFEPGQFNMLYVFGNGEVPISFSGDPARAELVHTVRSVGLVTDALFRMQTGATVGIRGPFGSHWPAEAARGGDVVIVAGGIGLAPLRPLIYRVLAEREAFGRVCLLYGARRPADLLYQEELAGWASRADMQVLTTVDAADEHWAGPVGVVPSLLRRAEYDPARATAFVCGPEVMMRFTIQGLEQAGVASERVYLSLERNMVCAIGLCGHCQLGSEFVCMDGPVFAYPRIEPLMRVPEL